MRLSSADVEKRDCLSKINNDRIIAFGLGNIEPSLRFLQTRSAILVDRRENRAKRIERSDKSVSFNALNEKTDDIIWSTSKMRARFRFNRHLDEFFRLPFVESVNHYCRINHHLKYCD